MADANLSIELDDASTEEVETLLPAHVHQLNRSQPRRIDRIEAVMLKRCDLRNYCCHGVDDFRRRPDCSLVVAFSGILAAMGLVFLPMGLFAVYQRYHYLPTNYTVISHDVSAEFCSSSMMGHDDGSDRPTPWKVRVKGQYPDYVRDSSGNIKPRVDGKGYPIIWTGSWITVCGFYSDKALEKAQQKYPVGSSYPAWIWDDQKGYLIFRNPESQMSFLWVSIFFFALFLFICLLHVLSVLFCGFNSLFKPTLVRVIDPYRTRT